MESFESTCNELVKQPRFWIKMLIGILIAAVPFANILAFGYLRRTIKENTSGDGFILPQWDFSVQNLRQDFLVGLRELALLLVFLAGPALIGYVLGWLLLWISSSMCLLLAYCGILIGAPAVVYAMLYVKNASDVCSTKVVGSMFMMALRSYKRTIVPSFLFLCLVILNTQLLPRVTIGASIFFGLIFMLAFVRNLKIVHK
jgi:hypothetical protein